MNLNAEMERLMGGDKRCRNCRHWRRTYVEIWIGKEDIPRPVMEKTLRQLIADCDAHERGVCRRFPPSPRSPEVSPSGRCGEWESGGKLAGVVAMSVDELYISVRAGNVLRANGIKLISDLLQVTYRRMLTWRNCGPAIAKELCGEIERLKDGTSALYTHLELNSWRKE